MTQDEILDMVHEAKMTTAVVLPDLERFAALVAAAEREACAKVCDELSSPSRSHSDPARSWITGTLDCATAIRQRSQE